MFCSYKEIDKAIYYPKNLPISHSTDKPKMCIIRIFVLIHRKDLTTKHFIKNSNLLQISLFLFLITMINLINNLYHVLIYIMYKCQVSTTFH